MADNFELNRALGSRKVSSAGAAWLGSALNPYSDFQQDLVGYPDVNTQPSVVRMFSTQTTLSCPSGVSSNWDCAIYSTPIDSTGAVSVARLTDGTVYYTSTALSSTSLWGLTAVSAAAGSDVSLLSATATRTGLNSRNVVGEQGRVIAKGFEVNNTTADIYKQGTMTVALVPACTEQDTSVLYVDAAASPVNLATMHCKSIASFPETLAEVRAIPQSSQWEASKGVYFVPRLTMAPPVIKETVAGVAYETSTGSVASAVTSIDSTHAVVSTNIPIISTCAHDSFCNGVAFFSGLSSQTTLTLSYRTVVEYFPRPSSNLVSEATPSAAYEPEVFEVYNQVVKVAPYATPVDQNAAGDFFRKVLGAVRTVAPIASKVLTPFPLASKAVGLVGRAAAMVPMSEPMPPHYQFQSSGVPQPRRTKRRKPKSKRPKGLQRLNASYGSSPIRYR